MLRVRFTRSCGSYQPGDLAGFKDSMAADLVEAGVAALVADPPPVAQSKQTETAARVILDGKPMAPRSRRAAAGA